VLVPGNSARRFFPGCLWLLVSVVGLSQSCSATVGGTSAGVESAVALAAALPPAESVPADPLDLWSLPDNAKRVQASYQFQYGGPDGGATPRIILRLQDEDRFSIAASEFGKRIFTLEVAGDRALFLDHRAKFHCWLQDEVQLAALPLGSLPLRALPALLFDRLPLRPVSAVDTTESGIGFFDSDQRRWRVVVAAAADESGPAVDSWTVLQGDRPEVWLMRQGATRFLSARDLQLRWKKGHSEPLSTSLLEPTAPDDYPESCEGFESGV
jgi:hypothetical protein